MNAMQEQGPDIPYGTAQEAPRLDDILVFTSAENVAKIPKVSGPRAITWLLGVTIYCTIGIPSGGRRPWPTPN